MKTRPTRDLKQRVESRARSGGHENRLKPCFTTLMRRDQIHECRKCKFRPSKNRQFAQSQRCIQETNVTTRKTGVKRIIGKIGEKFTRRAFRGQKKACPSRRGGPGEAQKRRKT